MNLHRCKLLYKIMQPDFLPISQIPLPDGLTPIQKIEYSIFQEAISEVEAELAGMGGRDDADQESIVGALNVLRDKQRAQADEVRRVRLEVVEKELEAAKEDVEKDFKAAQERLYKRLVETLYVADLEIMGELQQLLGDEYPAFAERSGIGFPVMDGTQNRQAEKRPADAPVTLSKEEVQRDRMRIAGVGAPQDVC